MDEHTGESPYNRCGLRPVPASVVPVPPTRFSGTETAVRAEVFPAAYRRSNQFDIRVYPFHDLAELGILPAHIPEEFYTRSARTIHFIADTPVFDLVRLFKAMFTAQFHQRGIAGAVAVFHPIGRLSHIAVAAIDTQIRLDVHCAAKTDEFISTILVCI